MERRGDNALEMPTMLFPEKGFPAPDDANLALSDNSAVFELWQWEKKD